MSKFKDASENIKRLQFIFSGLTELADSMDKVDKLETYVVELEDKKASLVKDCEALKDSKELLEKEFEVTKDNLSSMLVDSESKVVKILGDAEAKAAKIVEEAQSKSKEIDLLIAEKLKKYEYQIEELDFTIKVNQDKVKASELKLKEVNEALEKIKGGI